MVSCRMQLLGELLYGILHMHGSVMKQASANKHKLTAYVMPPPVTDQDMEKLKLLEAPTLSPACHTTWSTAMHVMVAP